jgi:hypothetical protein
MLDKARVRKMISGQLNSSYLKFLIEIENVSKDIWTTDIKIIKYYTDHGIEHSYRIINYIFEILKNKNVTLSEGDYFILFASAFLHDIGMQCDLNKHEKLKKVLKDNNTLTQEFNHLSLDYTPEEIKELREIHNILSHNWIIQACKNESIDQKLNIVIRNINNAPIVQDIADVVLYHTKMCIDDLDDTCHYNPGKNNKKLLAAIFRLADELDIDARRVKDIKSLSNFSIDKYSEFMWWLHNRLKISFDKNNNIVLTANLNKNDKDYYSNIKELLIKQFEEKNEKIIKILYDNYIAITIKEINVRELDTEVLIPKEYYTFLGEVKEEGLVKEKTLSLNTKNIIPAVLNNCKKIGYGKSNFYELWEGSFGETIYYLILGKRKIEDTLKEAYEDIKSFNIKKITVISPKAKKRSVQKFIKSNDITVEVNVYELYDFVWEFIVERELKDIKTPPVENYVEQMLFTQNNLSETLEENLGNAFSYLYNQYVLEKNYDELKELEPIFIQARGGTGKSYLLGKLCYEINKNTDKTKKIAVIISSEEFLKKIRKINTNEKIDSLQKLLQVYADSVLGIKLDEKRIIQSFLTGNLVILIDGIDEYISVYNENFLIDDFFNSITNLYKELHNAKIIISSRFSPKMKNIMNQDSVKTCFLKGFDYASLSDYIEQRVKDDSSCKEKLIKNITDFFDGETYFSPFFIKVILDQYNKNNKKDNRNFELKSRIHNKNNDLVYFLIDREIDRQSYNLPISTVYNIFFEIILMMENKNSYSYIKIDDIKLAIEIVLGKDDEEFLDKFLINPLFERVNNTISFKFTFVKNYFMAKYFKFVLENQSGENNILPTGFIDNFSIYYTGYGEVFQQLVENFKDNTNLENIIKNILTQIKSETEEKTQQLISALLYLLFNSLENEMDTNLDRTNMLLSVLGCNKTIINLYIYGDFYPISFENIVTKDSAFYNYNNFTFSNFNSKSFFDNCALDLVMKEYKYNPFLTDSLFNSNCYLSKELLEACNKNKISVKDEINSMVDNFYTILQKFIKYDSLEKCKIFSTSIINNKFDNTKILNFLKKIGFIDKDTNSSDYYKISNMYRKSVLSLGKQKLYYPNDIVDIIKKLNHEFSTFNDNDIDDYFKELASS